MKGNCETCKWWRHPREEWGTCDRNVWDNKETLAYAEDGRGDAAYLDTHATFGCVQWEGKA